MTHKTNFKIKKNQCRKLPDLDQLEKRPVVGNGIKMEFKYLLSFNEHIFSASETLIVNIIRLNISHYNKHKAQSKLIKNKECATLKEEFILVLMKFRIDQITYTNLQKPDSFKLMATQSLETFDKFLHQTLSILDRILNRCNDDKHQLNNFIGTTSPSFLCNESICLEVRKYAITLHYHFTHIDFEIKTDQYFKEKLNNIANTVQSLHDKAMSKFNYPNIALNDTLKSESLTIYEENVEPQDIYVENENKNIGMRLIQQQNEHVDYMIKDKNFIENLNDTYYNLKEQQDNDIESSKDTNFTIFLASLIIIAFLCGVYYVYNRFLKRKIIKPSIEHVIKIHTDMV